MATTQNLNKNVENPTLNRLKGKRHSENTVEKQNRKTLQTLQYSAKGDNTLIGQTKENKLNGGKNLIKPTNKPVKIFADDKPSSPQSPRSPASDTTSTQTDPSLLEDLIEAKIQKTDIENLGKERGDNLTSSLLLNDEDDVDAVNISSEDLAGESTSESYWRILAEKRRQALNDTLDENELLHSQNASLREENDKLSDLANQAENMVSFLQSVVSQEDEEEESPNLSQSPIKSPIKSVFLSPSKSPDKKASEDEWLNIELEGDIVKSTEVSTSTPEAQAVTDKKW